MKKYFIILFLAFCYPAFAVTPSFQSFDTNSFTVDQPGNSIKINTTNFPAGGANPGGSSGMVQINSNGVFAGVVVVAPLTIINGTLTDTSAPPAIGGLTNFGSGYTLFTQTNGNGYYFYSTNDGSTTASILIGKSRVSTLGASIFVDGFNGNPLSIGIPAAGLNFNNQGVAFLVHLDTLGNWQEFGMITTTNYPGFRGTTAYTTEFIHPEQSRMAQVPPLTINSYFDWSAPQGTSWFNPGFNQAWASNAITFMAANGLTSWNYCFDYGLNASNTVPNADGTITIDTTRFPNITNLVTYAHSLGIHLGYHTFGPGTNAGNAGLPSWYLYGKEGTAAIQLRQIINWGFGNGDIVFVDDPINAAGSRAYGMEWSAAIAQTGYKIILGQTSFNFSTGVTLFNSGSNLQTMVAQLPLEETASSDNYWQSSQAVSGGAGSAGSVTNWLKNIKLAKAYGNLAGVGNYAQVPDNTTFVTDSNLVQNGLSANALMSSFFQCGSIGQLSNNAALYFPMLTNQNWLAIIRDPLCYQADPISSNGLVEVWGKKMAGLNFAFGVANGSNAAQTITLFATNNPAFSATALTTIVDVWGGSTNVFAGSIIVTAPTNRISLYLCSQPIADSVLSTNIPRFSNAWMVKAPLQIINSANTNFNIFLGTFGALTTQPSLSSSSADGSTTIKLGSGPFTFNNNVNTINLLAITTLGKITAAVGFNGSINALNTNTAPLTTSSPGIVLGTSFNAPGQRSGLHLSGLFTDALGGDPILVVSNLTSGLVWTNAAVGGVSGTQPFTYDLPYWSSNDVGIAVDRSTGSGASVILSGSTWIKQ